MLAKLKHDLQPVEPKPKKNDYQDLFNDYLNLDNIYEPIKKENYSNKIENSLEQLIKNYDLNYKINDKYYNKKIDNYYKM